MASCALDVARGEVRFSVASENAAHCLRLTPSNVEGRTVPVQPLPQNARRCRPILHCDDRRPRQPQISGLFADGLTVARSVFAGAFGATDGDRMTTSYFRLYTFNEKNKIVRADDLTAPERVTAIVRANNLLAAQPDWFAYELWQNSRRINRSYRADLRKAKRA
jgi:hypothetical protein